MIDLLDRDFGADARNRLDETGDPGIDGALAALETFYYALGHADLDTLTATWADDPLVQLDNPIGGILRGRDAVTDLYRRVFGGGLDVQVTFTDAMCHRTADTFLVSGRELGSYAGADARVPVRIRTTRVFAYDSAWRMVHHHGSIDDADELAAYQRAALDPSRS